MILIFMRDVQTRKRCFSLSSGNEESRCGATSIYSLVHYIVVIVFKAPLLE